MPNESDKRKRTSIEFAATDNASETIESWAKKSGFVTGNPLMKKIMDTDNNTYCYHSLSTNSCAYITINIADNKVHIETWIEYDFLLRILTLFIVPKSQRIDTKSPIGWGARIWPKRKVNKLLIALGQEKL